MHSFRTGLKRVCLIPGRGPAGWVCTGSWSQSACLRGVLVERGAAKPDPLSVRSTRPASSLSGLHPDSQRPPSLPPPWIGGLGSAAPLRSMSAEDSSNVEEMCPQLKCEWSAEQRGRSRSFSPLRDWFKPGFSEVICACWFSRSWRKRRGKTEAKQEQLTVLRHTSSSPDWLVVEPCCCCFLFGLAMRIIVCFDWL